MGQRVLGHKLGDAQAIGAQFHGDILELPLLAEPHLVGKQHGYDGQKHRKHTSGDDGLLASIRCHGFSSHFRQNSTLIIQ